MTIRKAAWPDLPAVSGLYEAVHDLEEAGGARIGWKRGVYPTAATAEDALRRGDLYVLEDDAGILQGCAIINGRQMPAYAEGNWQYPAEDSRVLVLHTLVIHPRAMHRGYARAFVAAYERMAESMGMQALRMDTNAGNERARRLYASLGYREAGIIPCIFNGLPDVPLVLLEKTVERSGSHESGLSGH